MGAGIWDLHADVAVKASIPATRVTDATPVVLAAFSAATLLDPGDRLIAVLAAFETNTGNTGGVWTITESATSGGTYAAATLGGALVATPASAGNDVQSVAIKVNPAKPFIKITYTGADANAEVDVTAHIVRIPRALVG